MPGGYSANNAADSTMNASNDRSVQWRYFKVDAAISEGETLEDFRKRFDEIVQRNGWTGWRGESSVRGRAWRTQLIYQQNLRSAYMAGRWESLQKFPYLKYKHNTVNNPREEHQAWDGLILARDDPWWQSHYPPNGWGCRCSAFGVSAARLKADGRKPDKPPPGGDDNVAPEFRYHVGEAHIGRLLNEQDMQMWRNQKGDAWERLTPKGPADFGRPPKVPLDPLPRKLTGVTRASKEQLRDLLRKSLGGEERVLALKVSPEFTHRVAANVEVLAEHVDPARARVIPLLPDVLDEPFEVWQSFERHKGTGRVVLRTRYVRAFDMPKKQGMVAVVEAIKGQLVGWTIIPTRLGYLERQRVGHLLYGR